MKLRLGAVVICVVALLGLSVPSFAHQSLRNGAYECWLSQIGQYSNYELKVRSGGRYALMLDDDVVGKAGEFSHSGEKIVFKSGYLKKKGYKGTHAVLDDAYKTHMIYLYKNGDLVYDCNNN